MKKETIKLIFAAYRNVINFTLTPVNRYKQSLEEKNLIFFENIIGHGYLNLTPIEALECLLADESPEISAVIELMNHENFYMTNQPVYARCLTTGNVNVDTIRSALDNNMKVVLYSLDYGNLGKFRVAFIDINSDMRSLLNEVREWYTKWVVYDNWNPHIIIPRNKPITEEKFLQQLTEKYTVTIKQ